MKFISITNKTKHYLSLCLLAVSFLTSCNGDNTITPPPPEEKKDSIVSVEMFKPYSTTDHEMIQKTVDYAALNNIKVVYIPEGEYEIDAAGGSGGISLKSNVHLKLDDKAVLKAIPNSVNNYNIILIKNASDVTVSGGRLKGERNEHTGTTGEWGMGINIYSSTNITVKDIYISDCWGDGIYIGGDVAKASKDILIERVHCDNNRRQGASLVHCNGIIIKDSKFNYTNGTAPRAGIDLEPNSNQSVSNVKVDNCEFRGNEGPGFLFYAQAGPVSDVELTNSIFDANQPSGININGVTQASATTKRINKVRLSNIKIQNNKHNGITISQANDIVIDSLWITDTKQKMAASINNSTGIDISRLHLDNFADKGANIVSVKGLKISSGSFLPGNTIAESLIVENCENAEISSLVIEKGGYGLYGKNTNDLKVNSIRFVNNSKTPARIEGCVEGKLEDCSFEFFQSEALSVSNAKEFTFANNTFSGGSIASSVTSSISFSGNSSGNTFSNNTINPLTSGNKPSYGIYLSLNTSSNTGENNSISSDSYTLEAVKDDSGGKNQIK